MPKYKYTATSPSKARFTDGDLPGHRKGVKHRKDILSTAGPEHMVYCECGWHSQRWARPLRSALNDFIPHMQAASRQKSLFDVV